jgi:peptidoglycan/xylan/chitin deacetylase (PgdA/CDA1 family)
MAKILMFHRVLPEKLIKEPNAYATFGTLISQEYFEEVLTYLVDNKFEFVNISDIQKRKNNKKLVALTFDDGYSDNFEYALPILQKHKVTATFFPILNPCVNNTVLPLDSYYQSIDEMILTDVKRKDYISGDIKKIFYWSKPEEQEKFIKTSFKEIQKNRVSYLQTSQIRYLADNGFEIGSHSVTHSLFTAEYMDENQMIFELKQSKNSLELITGKPVNSFCFPSGYYNELGLKLAKENGYTSVCIIKPKKDIKSDSLPAYERIFVKPNSLYEFSIALNNL